jgi:hypothetical protein
VEVDMAYGPTNNVVEYELSEHVVVDGVTITGDGDTESPLVFTGNIPSNANYEIDTLGSRTRTVK